MSSERENNYDLLRLICVLAVITNHVSDITLEWSNSYKWVTYFWEGLGAYAVPCFLMITGAFSINNPINCNAKVYWARVYKKIGIPTAIFSVFYFLWYFSLSYYKTGGRYT